MEGTAYHHHVPIVEYSNRGSQKFEKFDNGCTEKIAATAVSRASGSKSHARKRTIVAGRSGQNKMNQGAWYKALNGDD